MRYNESWRVVHATIFVTARNLVRFAGVEFQSYKLSS